MANEYYYNETRECNECGKRSTKRCYGKVIGKGIFPMYLVSHYTYRGKKIDSHKCPHCGHKHKIPCSGRPVTFPPVKRSGYKVA